MKKSIRSLALLVCLSPFLVQCVASEKDVLSLDMRLRTLDAKSAEMDRTLSSMKALPGSQAELANQLDRFKSRLLQLEAQLEEKTVQTRKIIEEQIAFKKANNAKIDQLAAQITSLNSQMTETSSQITTATENFNRLQEGRVKDATAQAEAAAKEAEMAKKKADKMSSKSSIEPEQTKKKKGAQAEDAEKPTTDTSDKPEKNESTTSDPLYNKGLTAFKSKKYKEAYSIFKTFLEKNPSSSLAPNARFWLGDCLFQQKEFELAILEYQKVIADYPKNNKAPAALFKQGQAFEKLEEKETAKIVYAKILNEYPKSEQVEPAKKRLAALK